MGQAWPPDGAFDPQGSLLQATHLWRDLSPQAKSVCNHLVDLPLPIFLPHTLVAWQMWLLPRRELITAGRSHAEEFISLDVQPQERNKGHSHVTRFA